MAPYTEYTYSPLDLLTNVTDDAGNTTDMTYDSLGRKLKMGDPDMGVWYYGYDANGQLVSQRDARGWPTTFTYDALGRLTSKFSTSDATFSDAFSCFTCFSGSAILPLGQAALRRHHPDQHQLHRPAAGRHRAVVLSCADVRPKPGAVRRRTPMSRVCRDAERRTRLSQRDPHIPEVIRQIKQKEKLMEVLHKLRNRLNTIQSSTDLLVDLAMSAEYPTELIEQISTDIQRAINAQVRFLGELQLVTLLRQQRLALQCASVDLPALVARVIQQLDADYPAHQCILTISIDGEIPPVWGDEPRLEAVLYRLLDNALQSTQENSGSTNVIFVQIAADKNNVACYIEDNGCGIASDDLAQLVTRLESTVPDAQSENITLELSGCVQVLRLQGGTLAITSPRTGQGTAVCMQLLAAVSSYLH